MAKPASKGPIDNADIHAIIGAPLRLPTLPRPRYAGHGGRSPPCQRGGNLSSILLPCDPRCKAEAAMSIRDGSSPEAYLCDQVRRRRPDLLRMLGVTKKIRGKTLGKCAVAASREYLMWR